MGVIAYAARKDIAREVAQGWLRAKGIPSQIRIDTLSLSHVSGRAVLGAPGKPDLTLERFDVDYDLNLLDLGKPLSRIRRVHLQKPDLVFSYNASGLSFGTLDALLKGGGEGGVTPEDILVEDARLRVRTDYGVIGADGGLSLHEGRLRALNFTLRPGELSGPLGEGALSQGYIHARAEADADAGEVLRIEARLSADDLSLHDAQAEGEIETRMQGAHADFDLRLPYRKLDAAQARQSALSMFDGQVSGDLALRLDAAQGALADVVAFEGNTGLSGRLDVENDHLNFTGQARILARMDNLQTGLSDARAVSLSGHDLQLKAGLSLTEAPALTLSGPLSAQIGVLRQDDLFLKAASVDLSDLWLAHGAQGTDLRFKGGVSTQRLAQGDLSLDGVNARLDGSGRLGAEGYQIAFTTDITGREGRYQGMGALAAQREKDLAESRAALIAANARLPEGTPPVPLPPDPLQPEGPDAMVAVTRAVDRFALRAEGVRVTLSGQAGNGDFDVRLGKTALIRPLSGGEVRITPVPLKPLISTQARGGFILTTAGEALPPLELRVADLGFSGPERALGGRLNLVSTLNVAPVYGARFDADAHFVSTPEGTRVTLDACEAVQAERADIGGRMTDVTLRLCPGDRPILAMTNGQWRSEGRFEALTANAPDYQVRAADGEGRFAAYAFADAPGLGFEAGLKTVKVTDALETARFYPVLVSGNVTQGRKALDGRFAVTVADAAVQARLGASLADVVLRSDVATGAGRADITAANLKFAPQQLQPLDLSPMLAGLVQRDATGKADFRGFFAWSKAGSESGGVLALDEMGFTGPAGFMEGVNGRLVFTSLSPLLSGPGQSLSVRSVTSLVPLKDVRASMQFAGDYLKLENAQVTSEGGDFNLAPMEVPFDLTKGFGGELRFEKVDFGKVVASSPFAKDVSFKGFVSGKWPFEYRDGKLSIHKGYLLGEGPGHLSIRRGATTQVAADGGVTAEAPTPVAVPQHAPENAIVGMAYQAMEDMAYDELSAAVNTDDKGLLNFNFRITGRYDPPQRKEAKIRMIDYLRGVWMEKPIDLPSGTPVNLNLDVNYNLDEFLKDYMEAQKRGGIDWSRLK